ncbi:MAG TPA: hypothetical protein ENJ90_01825 [Devosia sp.]|nr:hypothetical protein [Devosia sp.]
MQSAPRRKLSQDGYLVVREYLSCKVLEGLRSICRDVLDTLPREQFNSGGGTYDICGYSAFAEIVSHDDTAKVMAELGFVSFKWLGGHLRARPGYAPPQKWHQDWWGWSNGVSYHEKPLGLTFIYHLEDTTPRTGCLRAIPGSHHFWHELHELRDEQIDDMSWTEHNENAASASHKDEVAIHINAGDLVIMDNRLLRSAYANTEANSQNLLSLLYAPEFEEMPAPIQHRYAKMFTRAATKTGTSASRSGSPLDWPEDKRAIARHLFPQAATSVAEEVVNCRPARVRMRERQAGTGRFNVSGDNYMP